MKTGRITAKLRDVVPVCLMVEGKEVKRYKNIELPDSIKEVELLDFHFNVPADGKITFEIQRIRRTSGDIPGAEGESNPRRKGSHAGRSSRGTGTRESGTGHHPRRTPDNESGRDGGIHNRTGNCREYRRAGNRKPRTCRESRSQQGSQHYGNQLQCNRPPPKRTGNCSRRLHRHSSGIPESPHIRIRNRQLHH